MEPNEYYNLNIRYKDTDLFYSTHIVASISFLRKDFEGAFLLGGFIYGMSATVSLVEPADRDTDGYIEWVDLDTEFSDSFCEALTQYQRYNTCYNLDKAGGPFLTGNKMRAIN